MSRSLLILLSLCGMTHAQSGNDTKNLLYKLFTTDQYDKRVRPLKNQSEVMNVGVNFYLNAVIEFDEQDESLKIAGYLDCIWTDDYLQWDPALYNNVTVLHIPQEDVWKPDLSLRNTFTTMKGMGSTYLNVMVDYTGIVLWLPFQVFESTCSVNIKYYPFDQQTCDLKFVAWSYSKTFVEINKGKNGIMMEEYVPNAAWDVVGTSSREVNSYEASVIFTIKLKRKPTFFLINIICPVILLTVLNVFTFVLPVASGEKAGYSVTVFLALAVFLTILSSELPNNSDTVSLLAVYLTLMTVLSTLIVVVCLMELRLSFRNDETHPVGPFFRALHNLSQFLQCKTPVGGKVQPKLEEEVDKAPVWDVDEEVVTKPDDKIKWVDVVNSLDFLLFWISLVYTILCTTILYGLAVLNN